jgi:hypothetical protein
MLASYRASRPPAVLKKATPPREAGERGQPSAW